MKIKKATACLTGGVSTDWAQRSKTKWSQMMAANTPCSQLTSSTIDERDRGSPLSVFWVIFDWTKFTTCWLLMTFLNRRGERRESHQIQGICVHWTCPLDFPSAHDLAQERAACFTPPQQHSWCQEWWPEVVQGSCPQSCPTSTYQMPSQAMTMKSWSSLIVNTLMSGNAEIICSSGGRFLLRL